MQSQIPTISLNLDRQAKDIAEEIRQACLISGFFQVVDYDHIIPANLPSDALLAAQQFFDLPLITKRGLYKANHIAGGYEPYKALNLNPLDAKGYGHNEGFSFADASHPTALPDSELPEFKGTMTLYYEGVTALAKQIGEYLAIGLGLSSDYFEEFFKNQLAHVKLAHYYRPQGVDVADSMVGVAPHTDWGAITILKQDQVGGLEIFDWESSQWIQVTVPNAEKAIGLTPIQIPPTPNAFVVNLGDLLSRWTNDLYKSTQHRVISPPPGVHRYSIPFFSQGHPDYIIKVIKACIKEGEQEKYPPIRAEDYLRLKFESTYSMQKV